jgi:hypothetical protein
MLLCPISKNDAYTPYAACLSCAKPAAVFIVVTLEKPPASQRPAQRWLLAGGE